MSLRTTPSRRKFLSDAAGFACAPLFFPGLSLGAAKPERPKNLVLVELFGGMDTLSVLTPRDNDDYHRARPTLGIPASDLLPFSDDRGFPSNVAPLHDLWHDGLMRIVEGVGYPNSTLSHFRAREIWGAGMPNHASVVNGWVTRMRRHLWASDPNPEVLTHVGPGLPSSFIAPNVPVLCFERPEDMEWVAPCGPAVGGAMDAEPKPIGTGSPNTLERLRDTLSVSGRLGPRLKELSAAYKPESPFPATQFGRSLQTVSSLIQGGFGGRVYSISHGEFDMHTSDPKKSKRPQIEFAAGMHAFMQNLKGTSAHEDTLVLCYTEFGRRLKENSGGGSDHGAAGTMFLFGGKIEPGTSGDAPDLSKLDKNGSVASTLDFRAVYSAVIEQWFGGDHEPIMLEKLKVPNLI
jgi:uncharacterized protein (DUF1501 family)